MDVWVINLYKERRWRRYTGHVKELPSSDDASSPAAWLFAHSSLFLRLTGSLNTHRASESHRDAEERVTRAEDYLKNRMKGAYDESHSTHQSQETVKQRPCRQFFGKSYQVVGGNYKDELIVAMLCKDQAQAEIGNLCKRM
ncbi:hypothetical protein INR49_020235 [Caranx melampygus]|nr:hypothetical protein INR49_020235 [Caranx melampygus]